MTSSCLFGAGMNTEIRSFANIIAIPIQGFLLLYAPLHNFAALLSSALTSLSRKANDSPEKRSC